MTWIKICGTTNLDDAQAGVAAGADALGFIFAPSPRRIEPERARGIVAKLPPETEKIGVLAEDTAERVGEVVRQVGLTAVQLHWDAKLEFITKLHAELSQARTKIIRVLKVPRFEAHEAEQGAIGWDPFGAGGAELDPKTHEIRLGQIAALLFDTAGPDGRGGTGTAFDWNAARAMIAGLALAARTRMILAGGLTPANVADAIATLRPWGVDVCSGVERQHGKKDHEKVRAFVGAVRAADRL